MTCDDLCFRLSPHITTPILPRIPFISTPTISSGVFSLSLCFTSPINMPIPEPYIPSAELHHAALKTTFVGVEHPVSTTETRVLQFRGIKYASIPARFRQSKLITSYHPVTDASKYG